MEFLYCILYLATSGIVIFLLGRIYPRSWFCENRFPYKSRKWESDGQVYRKIGIHKWMTKLPDASVLISKIIPGFMPKKTSRLHRQRQNPNAGKGILRGGIQSLFGRSIWHCVHTHLEKVRIYHHNSKHTLSRSFHTYTTLQPPTTAKNIGTHGVDTIKALHN